MYKKSSVKKLFEEYKEYCKEVDIKSTSLFAFQIAVNSIAMEEEKNAMENFREWVAK